MAYEPEPGCHDIISDNALASILRVAVISWCLRVFSRALRPINPESSRSFISLSRAPEKALLLNAAWQMSEPLIAIAQSALNYVERMHHAPD